MHPAGFGVAGATVGAGVELGVGALVGDGVDGFAVGFGLAGVGLTVAGGTLGVCGLLATVGAICAESVITFWRSICTAGTGRAAAYFTIPVTTKVLSKVIEIKIFIIFI